jgi:hypothetical protein
MKEYPFTNRLVSIAERILAGSIHIRVLLAFVFGVVFLMLIVVSALLVHDLESDVFLKGVLAVVLALAAASVMAVVPGFFHSELTSKARGRFRITGSFIAFVLVIYVMFFLPPAKPPVEPKVIAFDVEPARVAAGAQVRISWAVEHVEGLQLHDATGKVLESDLQLQGSLKRRPEKDITYQLRGKVHGKWEELESKSVEVEAIPPTSTPTSKPIPVRSRVVAPRIMTRVLDYPKLAFELYAWLDGQNEWPTVVGTPEGMKIGGKDLGRAPWIVSLIEMNNPFPDHVMTISKANLHVLDFEPVDASSGFPLTIRSDLVPPYLIPEDCPPLTEPSGFGPRGYNLPDDAEHLEGILPASSESTESLWPGKNSTIPPMGNKQYAVFISANAPGKYEFSINLEWEVTDGSTYPYESVPYKFVFLDIETAQAIPKDFDGSRCP